MEKPGEVEGCRILRCEASTELAGDQVRREGAEGEGARGSLRTPPEETFAWPNRKPQGAAPFSRLIPSAQRYVWAATQPLGNAALGALFA